MPQKEEVNVIDQSSATPGPNAYIDGGATPLGVRTDMPTRSGCLEVKDMASSESLEKIRLFPKSSRAWRRLPLLNKLLGKEGKADYIGDWREEEEVSHNFIFQNKQITKASQKQASWLCIMGYISRYSDFWTS